MNKREAQINFVAYRKNIYASLNGTKGNLVKLSKSNLLSVKEKELLQDVINAFEKLRVEYVNYRKKSIITAKQQTKGV